MAAFSQSSGTTVSRSDVVETVFGSEKEYEEYLDKTAKKTVLETLVCYAVVDDLGIKYTDEMYKADLAEFASAYNAGYQTDYSDAKVESICNKNML